MFSLKAVPNAPSTHDDLVGDVEKKQQLTVIKHSAQGNKDFTERPVPFVRIFSLSGAYFLLKPSKKAYHVIARPYLELE